MSSRYSNNDERPPLVLGKISGPRGTGGELTVRVRSGEAARWVEIGEVWIAEGPGADPGAAYAVEGARAYRDRLVLKLAQVDTASSAAGLRGRWVLAPADEVPELPAGRYYQARLIGSRVCEPDGTPLGRVVDVAGSPGQDLLVIEDEAGREVLVPFVRQIVVEVDEPARRIVVRAPEGLLGLNREPERPAGDGQR